MPDIIEQLSGNLKEYTSIPFWSWNNELDPEELKKQITRFKEVGINGFIMHARTGLKTEYMSEKWFECVKACLNEAKRLDMSAWIYDENGWPSGFASGKLLQNELFRAQYIEYEVKNTFDKNASYVYSVVDGEAKRIKEGDWAENYHCLYIRTHGGFANILDHEVTDEFIRVTYEEYYKRFSNCFGKELVGFFTDEPQYFRYQTPFSHTISAEFEESYKENVFDGLIYLFMTSSKAKEFRNKYYCTMNKLYVDNYYKRVYEWCEKHNCKLTGHSIEENSLSGQMSCCAGVMTSYEYEHIPGVDWLGRYIDIPINPKQVSSVAQQLNKKHVLTETFACSGWDTTPLELRRIADFQYVNGVNMMCQHLTSYSLKGAGKNDHPPSFSAHTPWWKDYKVFNDYYTRYGYIVANTKEQANTLVIHPIRSAYLSYDRATDYDSIKQLEEDFRAISSELTAKYIQYHYGDETIMEKHAKIVGSQIVVGSCCYDYVIIPPMESVSGNTAKLLEQFVSQGGKVCCYGKSPWLIDGKEANFAIKSNLDIQDIKNEIEVTAPPNSPLMTCHRRNEDLEVFIVFNSSKTDDITFSIDKSCRVLNLEKLRYEDATAPMTLNAMETVIFSIDNNAKVKRTTKKTIKKDITERFEYVNSTENNLTVDFVQTSFDGKNYSNPELVYCAAERLIKGDYRGKLWLKYAFEVDTIPKKAKLVAEKMNILSTCINGNNLKMQQSDFDVMFVCADIEKHIKIGSNEIIFVIDYYQSPNVRYVLYDPSVKESLKNCLAVDTEIENVYIRGEFAVNKNRQITDYKKIIGVSDFTSQGFTNFAGSITIKGWLNINNKNCSLRLFGRYMTANYRINGKFAGKTVISNKFDLSEFVVEGQNLIEIELTSSLRNMFGPFHFAPDKEPKNIGPFQFNMIGRWNNGKADIFTKDYSLIKFGLDKIILED